jgi:two-component system chemotaxis response regulator CheB
VVMVSSQTRAGAEPTLRALELGAVDFVPKPTQNVLRDTSAMAQAIAETVVQAARARLGAPGRRALGTARGSGPAPAGQRAPAPRPAPPAQTPIGPSAPLRRTAGRQHRWLALGASTGGTEALRTLLCALPADLPPVVVVQHMPEHFTAAFARRLSTVCPCAVREAQDGDRLERGLALVAPGGRQMEVAESGGVLRVRLSDDPPVNRHRPSVDTLFLSLAQVAGADGVAALLTGMGDDGARGLLALRRAGSHTIAQDEASSVVYGMPRVAAELGAAVEILPLERIAAACLTGATKAA